jgi:protein-S-isoprenylcysteine O-methyltransferase Ste14
MFTLARAVTYSTLFVGLLLVFLPSRLLDWTGATRPTALGGVEIAAIVVSLAGAGLTLWSILAFVFIGKGTPAPFDPPRRLVVRGPYRYVRNPIYIGALLALGGAAIFYRSLALLAYLAAAFLILHLLVVIYEEPALGRQFDGDYEAYRARVNRWLPRTR